MVPKTGLSSKIAEPAMGKKRLSSLLEKGESSAEFAEEVRAAALPSSSATIIVEDDGTNFTSTARTVLAFPGSLGREPRFTASHSNSSVEHQPAAEEHTITFPESPIGTRSQVGMQQTGSRLLASLRTMDISPDLHLQFDELTTLLDPYTISPKLLQLLSEQSTLAGIAEGSGLVESDRITGQPAVVDFDEHVDALENQVDHASEPLVQPLPKLGCPTSPAPAAQGTQMCQSTEVEFAIDEPVMATVQEVEVISQRMHDDEVCETPQDGGSDVRGVIEKDGTDFTGAVPGELLAAVGNPMVCNLAEPSIPSAEGASVAPVPPMESVEPAISKKASHVYGRASLLMQRVTVPNALVPIMLSSPYRPKSYKDSHEPECESPPVGVHPPAGAASSVSSA